MTINLQIGGYVQSQPLPAARSADVQLGVKPQAAAPAPKIEVSVPVLGQNVPAGNSPEEKRYEQVVFAAKNLFKDVYVVSDQNFTIFKDATGQYVTRYTSLRDGKVTYIPELKLIQMFQDSEGGAHANLELKV